MTGKANLLEPGFSAALARWTRILARASRIPSGRGRMLDDGLRILLLGVVYVLAARVGVLFALSGGTAATVWSPAGIAVGGLVLWGTRLWPAVAVGALVAAATSGWSPVPAVVIATGATVEALAAAALLARAGFRGRFDRLRDVIVFAVAGCALPAAFAASSSVVAHLISGSITVDGPAVAWLVSWAGDAIRILVVGGLMLAWLSPAAVPFAGRRSEAVVGVASVVGLAAVLFFDMLDLQSSGQSVAFPIIPVLIWVAFRVGPKGTTLSTAVLSVIALVATERGLGPFVATTGEGSLMYVAVFLGLVTVTGDAVAAVVAEREAGRSALALAGQHSERALGQLQAIEAIGRTLAEDGPTPEALDSVMGSLVEVFGYPNPAIYTGDRHAVRLGAQRGYDDPIVEYDDSHGIIGRVMRSGEGVFLRDVSLDPGFVRVDPRMVSEIAIPLRAHGEFLGVLNVESDAPLDERDLSCVTVVADRVAAALALARERIGLAARAEIFTRLATFTRRVTGVLAQDELYRETVVAIDGVMPADLITLTVLDPSTHEYVVRAEKGSPGSVGSVIHKGEGPAGIAIRDRTVTTLTGYGRSDFPEALRATNLAAEYATAVGVPLLGEEVVIGALVIARIDRYRPFTDLELEALELLARAVTLAVSNAFLHGEVSERAVRDALTGLHNRRYFDSAFAQLLAARKRIPEREQPPLSAIMFDLDHFGSFNKSHGHQVGDAVLRAFGRILARRLREGDLVARYGGEEFMAIVPGATSADARRIADDIRTALEETVVEGVTGEALHVTVSAGCATAERTDRTGEALIRAADVGLIMAKRAGRNRVVSA